MANILKPLKTPEPQDSLSSEFLGALVRARRTQLGLRIDDAAAFCGVAKDTLMKLEHGNPKVQLCSVLQICKGLGIVLQVKSWENEAKEQNDAWV
jgi:transcriptional regulator with XRE-family HTH domain